MKVASKIAVLVSLGALAPFVSAKSIEQSYLDSCRKDPAVPVPLAVVSPRVSPENLGQTAEVEFTVSETGKTSDFKVRASDSAFADAVLAAVKKWEFAPARRDGQPVSRRVLLPVRVVDESQPNGYAVN